MKREIALAKVDSILRVIKEGHLPYRVLQLVLYGSTAKGDQNPNDVDIYIQLDKDSVPKEEGLSEVFRGYGKGDVSKNLRKVLKENKTERVSIQWDFISWEEHSQHFVKPEEIENVAMENISELNLSFKTHQQAKNRILKSVSKRSKKPIEWPPKGIVLYELETKEQEDKLEKLKKNYS